MTDYDDTTHLEVPKTCFECGTRFEVGHVSVSPFPYVHVDLNLRCPKCDMKFTFGIPAHHASGMTLYIYQSQGILKTLNHVPRSAPLCPFHDRFMKLTKIFGDRAGKKHDWRYQYKCPECYLVLHKDKDGSVLAPKDLKDEPEQN